MQKILRFINRIAGLVAICLAIVSMLLGIAYQVRVRDTTNCQTMINQEFLAVIKERSQLNNEDMSNVNVLIVELLNSAKNTKAQDIAEGEAYLKELSKINGELSTATYPDFQSC